MRQEPTEELGGNRQHTKPLGNSRVREVLHGSAKTMAAKPSERLLSAVREHYYRKGDPQDESDHATIGMQQQLSYSHRAIHLSRTNVVLPTSRSTFPRSPTCLLAVGSPPAALRTVRYLK